MIVLDTNVVSELMRTDAAAEVVAWVDRHPGDQVFITAVTAAELFYGVARLADGRRTQVLAAKVRDMIDEDFEDQVLPFSSDSAHHYADIVTSRERIGKRIRMADGQIAAICRQYALVLAHATPRTLPTLASASSTPGTECDTCPTSAPARCLGFDVAPDGV